MNYVTLVVVVPCNARNSTLFRSNPWRDSSPTGVLYCVTKEESQSGTKERQTQFLTCHEFEPSPSVDLLPLRSNVWTVLSFFALPSAYPTWLGEEGLEADSANSKLVV